MMSPLRRSYETAYLRYRFIGAAFAHEAQRLLRQLPITYLAVSDLDIAWLRDPTPYLDR